MRKERWSFVTSFSTFTRRWVTACIPVVFSISRYHAAAYVENVLQHYGDVIMGAIASQITSFTIVYSTIYSDADQRNHQSSASLAFVRGIHQGPVNSPQKRPVTRTMFPFDDVIMILKRGCFISSCLGCANNLSFYKRHLTAILLNENFDSNFKSVHTCPINNKSALVQLVALQRSGDTSLCEPRMNQLTDALTRYAPLDLDELSDTES